MKSNTYLLTEQIMNGAVTMETIVSGIRASSFGEAKKKLLKVITEIYSVRMARNDEDELSYVSSTSPSSELSVYGHMNSIPLKYLK
jgi:hypothetical protein